MAAGRKARPVALKIIEGQGPGRDGQQRDSGGRPIKPPVGFLRLPPDKPEGMSPVAAEMWDRVLPELQRVQITKPIDGPALEMLCETYSRWHAARAMRIDATARLAFVKDSDGVETVKELANVGGLLGETSQGWSAAPWIGIEERAAKDYRSWCSEFGLTPAAETKVGGAGGEGDGDDNPFGAS